MSDRRKALRRAALLIRRVDRFADGKLTEDGMSAKEIALELDMLANDLIVLEATERIRELYHEDFGNVVDLHSYSRKVPCA